MNHRPKEEIEALIDADTFSGLGAYYKAMNERDYSLAMQICACVQLRLNRAGRSSRTDEYKQWDTRYIDARNMKDLDIWVR